jgi:hypothetical protein
MLLHAILIQSQHCMSLYNYLHLQLVCCKRGGFRFDNLTVSTNQHTQITEHSFASVTRSGTALRES